MSHLSSMYLLILLASFEYTLCSKEIAITAQNDDAIIVQSDGNKVSYCCAPMKANSKWITKCQLLDTKFGCERKSNKCKWQECSRVGYCRWTAGAAGNDHKIADLCSRQTNAANCVNKITDGSGKCDWIHGYPPIPSNTESIDTDDDLEQQSKPSDLEDSGIESDGKDPYCCSRTTATPKWTDKCPEFDSKFGCERIINKCKWDLCSKVGYCQATGVNTGNSDKINNLCSRQTNKANCVNKITDGSGNCDWVYGYPPITTLPPPDNKEFVDINSMVRTTSKTSFYSIEFVILLLFLVSISFITYTKCCVNEYKSEDMVLMDLVHVDERKGLLSQI